MRLRLQNNWIFWIVSRTGSNDSYAYPGLSDLTRPFTSNGLNQYTATSGITNSYDANGNTTSDERLVRAWAPIKICVTQ